MHVLCLLTSFALQKLLGVHVYTHVLYWVRPWAYIGFILLWSYISTSLFGSISSAQIVPDLTTCAVAALCAGLRGVIARQDGFLRDERPQEYGLVTTLFKLPSQFLFHLFLIGA
jgi:hypothetical protein